MESDFVKMGAGSVNAGADSVNAKTDSVNAGAGSVNDGADSVNTGADSNRQGLIPSSGGGDPVPIIPRQTRTSIRNAQLGPKPYSASGRPPAHRKKKIGS